MKICGIDEAGRGPLAGPVCAAAVILENGFPTAILDDSKKMTPAERARSASQIMNSRSYWGIGWVWPVEIDHINIHHATLLAMQRSYLELQRLFHEAKPKIVLVDGKFCPDLQVECQPLIKGDTLVPEIQAASILAKEARDRWMIRYSWIETEYGFERHKGYPTLFHRQQYRMLGPCAIHRLSFTADKEKKS